MELRGEVMVVVEIDGFTRSGELADNGEAQRESVCDEELFCWGGRSGRVRGKKGGQEGRRAGTIYALSRSRK